MCSSDLLFVVEGSGVREEVVSMPGVLRFSVDQVVDEAKRVFDLGVTVRARWVFAFGVTVRARRVFAFGMITAMEPQRDEGGRLLSRHSAAQ